MKRIRGLQQISHKGKEIIFSDYGELSGQEFIDQMKRNVEECAQMVTLSGGCPVLILSDVTDAMVTPTVFDALKQYLAAAKPFTKARAVVGVTGAKKQLLQLANLSSGVETRAFSTLEEAKEWLVQQ